MKGRRFANIPTFAAALSAIVASAYPLAALAESATSTEAEHTPFPCENPLTVDALAKYKAPKAAKRYHIELSIPALNNPYIQALVYGAQKAARNLALTLQSIPEGALWIQPHR